MNKNEDQTSYNQNVYNVISRFINNSLSPTHQLKLELEKDFLSLDDRKLQESMQIYSRWIEKLEKQLKSRPMKNPLELFSHYLVEFEHQKFDDVEIPGQYLQVCLFNLISNKLNI